MPNHDTLEIQNIQTDLNHDELSANITFKPKEFLTKSTVAAITTIGLLEQTIGWNHIAALYNDSLRELFFNGAYYMGPGAIGVSSLIGSYFLLPWLHEKSLNFLYQDDFMPVPAAEEQTSALTPEEDSSEAEAEMEPATLPDEGLYLKDEPNHKGLPHFELPTISVNHQAPKKVNLELPELPVLSVKTDKTEPEIVINPARVFTPLKTVQKEMQKSQKGLFSDIGNLFSKVAFK